MLLCCLCNVCVRLEQKGKNTPQTSKPKFPDSPLPQDFSRTFVQSCPIMPSPSQVLGSSSVQSECGLYVYKYFPWHFSMDFSSTDAALRSLKRRNNTSDALRTFADKLEGPFAGDTLLSVDPLAIYNSPVIVCLKNCVDRAMLSVVQTTTSLLTRPCLPACLRAVCKFSSTALKQLPRKLTVHRCLHLHTMYRIV